RLPVAGRTRADSPPYTTPDGSTSRGLIDPEAGGARNQSLAEATLAPGQATERHYHAETEELYVVLAGSGEMEVDGERREVGPGDAVLLPPGAWHQIRAGDDELRFLCCCAPPYRHEDTFFA
ncbi:MAG TPA: cupin domain-containing protein, partial [Gaiellaceae bacterium]|nr:cupin domain-containing protein [Gaiellaceae bacterium]